MSSDEEEVAEPPSQSAADTESTEEGLVAAISAVKSGGMSQREAAKKYGAIMQLPSPLVLSRLQKDLVWTVQGIKRI